MKIVDGVYMLEISAEVMGERAIIYPTVICEGSNDITLIDAGYPGQIQELRRRFENEGLVLNDIQRIVISHQDIDHIGGVSIIVEENTSAVEVLCHEMEKTYIDGSEIPVKLAQLESTLDFLPDNMKMIYGKLKSSFHDCKVDIDTTLVHNQKLTFGRGIRIIHTPGHTPGHICLYLEESKILVAGDILTIKDGELAKLDANINYDNELNNKSIRQLLDYDIEALICYHGGIYYGDVKSAILKLIQD